tara:strand:+ start:42574 stop:42996 length:423 start_codon:yes stop_codon:yes gene_type:complete
MSKKDMLNFLNGLSTSSLIKTLNIEYSEIGENYLVAKMPVNSSVHQPDGILHGGATAALAETVGSTATRIFSYGSNQSRGIELSINHVRSVSKGYVYAKAKAIHMGKSTQLWNIEITDDDKRIISIAKLTTLTLNKNQST